MSSFRERRAALKHKIRHRGIYLLPNLVTTGNLFCGFYAIVQAMNLEFERACIAIVLAMILDTIDGRVARATKTQSAFGAEYDSLSDMLSFGAAPAIILYEWSLSGLGKLGLAAAFVYCAAAALRLARFNVQIDIVDKRFFSGLPSPAAAALMIGFVWVMHDYEIDGKDLHTWALVLTLFAGISMVTTAQFYSFKDFNAKKSVPFVLVAAVALGGFAVATLNPSAALFAGFVVFGVSGYVYSLYKMLRNNPSEPS
jgi:CDP-diacylglycerol---serine O-phosphatidyltransferase